MHGHLLESPVNRQGTLYLYSTVVLNQRGLMIDYECLLKS